MSENPLPTRQAIEAKGRSAGHRVTGKLKLAIGAMIWEGLPRAEAAAKAGMVDGSQRFALRKASRAGAPHCRTGRPADLAARQER